MSGPTVLLVIKEIEIHKQIKSIIIVRVRKNFDLGSADGPLILKIAADLGPPADRPQSAHLLKRSWRMMRYPIFLSIFEFVKQTRAAYASAHEIMRPTIC